MLARAGVEVDVVEARPGTTDTGSGITLQGNALRVLRDLGAWPQVSAQGFAFDSLGLRAPDAHGTLLAEVPDVRTGGPDLPATLGMSRPALAGILLDLAAEAGAKVRLGVAATGLDQDADGVDVTFSDASTRRYDLVVGADGIRSWTRRTVGIDAEPEGTGMGIWRVSLPRPADVVRTDLTYGGPCHIAGYCPTGPDSVYAYLVEDVQDRSGLTPAEQVEVVRGLAAAYHGPWDALRESLSADTPVNYTRFETHLVEGPWHQGRVVLVGDAVHSCPPTIAQGAAQALEDSAVLADLLLGTSGWDEDVLVRYADRRRDRARQVVEASVQIGRWMLDRTPREQADVPGLLRRISSLVEVPA
ncbi:FAD-dependent oxidoreductase [Kineococcus endophyticus]